MSGALVAAFGCAFALGGTTVAYPLIALDAGYSAAMVGILTSVSAVSQLLARFALPWLLGRVPDRVLMRGGNLVLACSGILLFFSTGLGVFIAAQLLQGASRAVFWTSTQSHAIGAPGGSVVARLAKISFAGKVGAMAGPLVTGVLAGIALPLGLWGVIGGGLIAAAGSLLMVRHVAAPREAPAERRQVWRRGDFAPGYAMNLTAGGWRGILDSYVPVILSSAGMGAITIGWLVTVAEMTPLAASGGLARFPNVSLRPLIRVASSSVLVGTAILPLVASTPALAALVLGVAGFGGGLAATISPAIATEAARDSERGTVLAVLGGYRALARMAAPSGIAGIGVLVGIPLALVTVTAVLVVPALGLAHRYRPVEATGP